MVERNYEFPGFFLDPENGSDMHLRNGSWLSTDYTVLYPWN
jgi:hypothetical protein